MENTTTLTNSHWTKIRERIDSSIGELAAQNQPSQIGRSIPSESSLLIGEGRYLKLAILFLDICSFTSWKTSNQNEQKDVLQIFNVFMSEMFRIVGDYGGEVEKNTGDGFMAYFEGSAPNPEQESCERAIAAAITMFHATGKIINPVLSQNGFPIVNFRIGIDHGDVTIAKVGTPRQFNAHVAIGTTANIASRILGVAPQNEIIIGEQVYKNLRPERQQYCSKFQEQTGFVYIGSGLPYPYYKYTGRWKDPV